MNGQTQGAAHQRHHHQPAPQAEHAGSPAGDAAHSSQPTQALLLVNSCACFLLGGPIAHDEGQNDIHQRLHRQQHPAGDNAGQTTKQQGRSKGRPADHQGRAQWQGTVAQMGYEASQRRGNDGEAAGGQSLVGGDSARAAGERRSGHRRFPADRPVPRRTDRARSAEECPTRAAPQPLTQDLQHADRRNLGPFVARFSSDGRTQMVLDRLLLERAGEAPLLRFYTWDGPWLSLGRHQRSWPEHWNALEQEGRIGLVRRPSGGQAVLHAGGLTYALIWPSAPRQRRGGLPTEACQWLLEGFLPALASRCTSAMNRRPRTKRIASPDPPQPTWWMRRV